MNLDKRAERWPIHDKDVLGLQIAVNYSFLFQIDQSIRDLSGHIDDILPAARVRLQVFDQIPVHRVVNQSIGRSQNGPGSQIDDILVRYVVENVEFSKKVIPKMSFMWSSLSKLVEN